MSNLFYTSIERIGKFICYRGYNMDGKPFFKKEEYKPILYLPTKNKNSKWKTLYGEPVEEFIPGNINDASEYIKKYKDVDNFTYYGMTNWIYNFTGNRFPGTIDYNFSHLKIGKLDIETTCADGFPNVETANEKILIATIEVAGTYHVFYYNEFGKYTENQPNVIAYEFDDEAEMLKAFVAFWEGQRFDIITGWYSEPFDIPYLVNRIDRLLGEDWVVRLSPWRKVKAREYPISKTKRVKTYDIVGINHIDYMLAIQKFGGTKYENYKLDTVAHEEVGTGKLDYSEYGSLHELYLKDFNKAIVYNVRDVELLELLDRKKKMLELIFDLSLLTKTTCADTFKQTRMWDSIIHYSLLERNQVIPSGQSDDLDDAAFEGAYVKEIKPGMIDWVFSLDLDSLYPHLIMWANMSPETFLEKIPDINLNQLVHKKENHWTEIAKEKNVCLTGNGALFRKDFLGILPELMRKFYTERRIFKKQMIEKKIYLEENRQSLNDEETNAITNIISKLDMFQNNRKTGLNSAYGAVGNNGFRYFKREIAESITLSGQLAIRWIERKLNEFFNDMFKTVGEDYCTLIDTDSASFHVIKLVNALKKKNPEITPDEITTFLDNFITKKVQPFIEESYQELADYMNAYDQSLRMKRESITETVVQIAKKKYAYNVRDLEGVRFKEPYLKVTGIEIVRSSTPEFCRKRLKDSLKVIMNKDQRGLIDLVEQTREEFMKLEYQDIFKPSGVNGVEDYEDGYGSYRKGTPIHVRGAILYNSYLKKLGLDKKYPYINDGDKIKYCYLKLPNPIHENIIAIPTTLPEEFGLEKYLDRDLQFEKVFLSPINIIADAIGWKLEDENTLEDLFS